MKLERLVELFAFRNVFRLMMAPAAWLAPVTALAAAVTCGSLFGRWGAFFGLASGLALGVVLVVVWYAVILGKLFEDREESFADDLVREAREGRLRRKPPAEGPVDPLPLEPPAAPLAVSIDGSVADAVTRIDAHAAVDPGGALAAAEALHERHPREPAAAILLARSLARASRPHEAMIEAGKALHVAVLRGELDAAAELVVELWSERDRLVLDRSVREALAAHFEDAGDAEKAAALRDRTTEA